MKALILIVIAAIVLTGCGSKELSKDEALTLIRKERGYPRVFDHDIFCGDPKHARNVLDKGLEKSGLVIVHQTVKLKDIGKNPIIEFTDKAKPYLLPTPEEDRKYKIQKVKLADEDISEITAIIHDKSNSTAIVEYNTLYKNLTPFTVLIKRDVTKPVKNEAYFALSDKGWVIRKRN